MPDDDVRRVSARRRLDTDRGQMFLVVAVVVAALLVVLTVVLNSALYAGNLTASDDGVDDASALTYRHGVVEGTALLVTRGNQDDLSYPELHTAAQTGVEAWSDLARRHAAADVSGASVDYVSPSDGTLIEQPDERVFLNDAGDTDSAWELTTTKNVRSFHLNVVRTELVDPDPSDESSANSLATAGVFAIALHDGTGLWRVFVYQEASTNEVVIRVEDPSGLRDGNCRAPAVGGRVLVDVSNATVGGKNCPQLDVLDDPAGTFDVRFERGEGAAGTYSLVTDEDFGTVNDGDFSNPDAGPRASHALYSVTVELTYVTPELRYETTVEVVPGETP